MSEYLRRETIWVRPRYKRETDLSPCQVTDQILQALINKREVKGTILKNTVYLKIPEDEQRYWSPVFEVTVSKKGDNESLIRGVIGPKPEIWTMFMFFYAVDFVLLFFGVFMGISQWLLGMDAPMLWSVPAFVLLWFLIYMAGRYGRIKARRQTGRLLKFLDEAIDSAEQAETE
ncbi:MAG: hypothetical protein GXO86_14990 [Chlorobi bacterium]|nr:hypothetical protein [Chlorobiota bacterium]